MSKDFREQDFHKKILAKDELLIFDKATDGNHLVLPKKWIRTGLLTFIGFIVAWLVTFGYTAKDIESKSFTTIENRVLAEKRLKQTFILKKEAIKNHNEIKAIALKSDSAIVIIARSDYTLFNNKLDNMVKAQEEANKLTKILLNKALDK